MYIIYEFQIAKRLDVLYFQMKRNKITMKRNMIIQREMWNQLVEKLNILISTQDRLRTRDLPRYNISQSRKSISLLNIIPDKGI